MSTEQIGSGQHPEIAKSLEAKLPPSAKTEAELLSEIKTRIDRQTPDEDGDASVSYDLSGAGDQANGYDRMQILWKTPRSTDNWHPGHIGRINLAASVPHPHDPDKAPGIPMTHYFFSQEGNGLTIEKFTTDHGESFEAGEAGNDEAVDRIVASQNDALEQERELGLTFVSEKEAKDLLELIRRPLPEIRNIEADMPANEAIRHELLSEVGDRISGHKPDEAGDVNVHYNLDTPDYDYMVLSWKTPDSGLHWKPNQIGHITMHIKTPDEDAMPMTHYEFFTDAKGIMLEKYTDDVGDMRKVFQTQDDPTEALQEAWRTKEENLQAEREMGLTVVSQQDAKNLLATLKNLRDNDEETNL